MERTPEGGATGVRVGTWPKQGSMCRGGAGRLETGVPLRTPLTLGSCSLGTTGGFWPSEALASPAPVTPTQVALSLLISALGLEQRRGGARHRPSGLFCASGQSRENEDWGPQGNQDAAPALPECKAQPRGARRAGVREVPETPARCAPRAPRGVGWLSRSHPAGPPEERSPAPASQAGLPGVPGRVRCTVLPIAASGAALAAAAARSGRAEANYAAGQRPGPGSTLRGIAAARASRRAAAGAGAGKEAAAAPAGGGGGATGPGAPAPPPPPTACNSAGAGPRPPHLLKVCTRRREKHSQASRPRGSRARAGKARRAAGCPRVPGSAVCWPVTRFF